MNRNHVQARRHHLFQIFEHLGPGKRLALKQIVQKLRAVARTAVLRQVEKRLGGWLSPRSQPGNLLPACSIGCGLCRRDPARHQRCRCRSSGHQAQRRQPLRPSAARTAGILVRLSREIDFEAHITKAMPPPLPPFSTWESSRRFRRTASGDQVRNLGAGLGTQRRRGASRFGQAGHKNLVDIQVVSILKKHHRGINFLGQLVSA